MQNLNSRCILNSLPLFICLFIIFSCNSSNNSQKYQQKDWGNKKNSFKLSLSDIEGAEKYDLNDIFDSIHYVPLQTTKESTFSKINQMEVTDKYFIISDRATNSILVFGKDGTFKFKLKSNDISDFTVDETKGHIVFQDKHLRKVYIYNFKGQLVDTHAPTFNYTGLSYLDSNKIAYYRYMVADNDIKFPAANILIGDSSNILKHTFIPYDTTAIVYREMRNSIKPFYKSNHDVYFPQPYDNKIFYNLKNDNKPDYFTIDFPEKYTLPNDFLVNAKYLNKRLQYFKDNPYQAFLIQNLYIVDSLMTFEVTSEKWRDIFLYDLRKQKAISVFNLLSGPKNTCLPQGRHFLAADDKSFYRSTTAIELFNAKQVQQAHLYSQSMPKEMKVFYQTQNNLSNPVVVQLFPKKNLNGLKKKV